MNFAFIPRRASIATLAVLLLAAIVGSARGDGVHLRMQPGVLTVDPNQEFDVELYVFQADEAFNAFDASIRFDPSRLTFVPASNVATQRGELMTAACSNTFHRFTSAPDSLQVSLSLLCNGASVAGPGVIYRVRFRSNASAGPTMVTLGPYTRFYHAGYYVDPLESEPMQVCISNCTTDAPSAPSEPFGLRPPSPNPWPVNRPGRFEFALAESGPATLELFDISGRRIASQGPQWCEAGPHAWTLARPDGASGICFARLITLQGSSARTVVLLH